MRQKRFAKFLIGLMVSVLSAPALSLVVLQYHHISNETPASTSISPERFKKHLDYLERNEYSIISMQAFIRILSEKKTWSLPDKTALITFDDGYDSIYHNAWPELKKRDWPFTVFINSDHHEQYTKPYMTWAQLKEMAEAGVSFGNHSVSHTHLIRRQENESFKQWLKRIEHEIDGAQKIIDKHLGPQPRVFAYPFGEYNNDIEAMLKSRRYLAFSQHSGPVSPLSSLTALPRFPFGGNYGTEEDFAVKVSSLPLPVSKSEVFDEKKQELTETLLPKDVSRPVWVLSAESQDLLKTVQCFASGQGSIPTRLEDNKLIIQAPKPLPTGRSRYNCTASAGGGRFYWMSQSFIRKLENGSWYSE